MNASGNLEFYMSCSSVNIKGTEAGSNITPRGPPLLIANLDPIRDECYTNYATSIIYPSKYDGITATERAPIALKLEAFPVKNPDGCGSDNVTILNMLKKPVDRSAVDGQGPSTLNSTVTTVLISNSVTQKHTSIIKALCLPPSGAPHVPKPPLPGAAPDPLWAVPDGQRACFIEG